MNTLVVILFLVISVVLFGAAFGLMYANITALAEQKYSPVVTKKTVTRPIHPEMVDVEPGEELMVVNFMEDDDEDDDGDIPAIVRR
tara:strand:- start:626 stop:883 length:258 start_codon:yes stop_codon:yes gene_type:complete